MQDYGINVARIALDVARGRKTDRGELGQFEQRGRTRKARALSILPKDRFDEKIAAIQAELTDRGVSVNSNTEIVIFALDLAVNVLGADVAC